MEKSDTMDRPVLMNINLHKRVKLAATKEDKSIKDFVSKIVETYLENQVKSD